jgi:hypothetical protein
MASIGFPDVLALAKRALSRCVDESFTPNALLLSIAAHLLERYGKESPRFIYQLGDHACASSAARLLSLRSLTRPRARLQLRESCTSSAVQS